MELRVLAVTLSGGALARPLLGGALIGAAVAALWILDGRLAGVSGVLGDLLPLRARGAEGAAGSGGWRIAFVAGLVAGGLVLGRLWPGAFAWEAPAWESPRSMVVLAASGLLVGFGTRLGGGCTSGHGLCGVSRGTRRSLLATGVFMALGAIAVYVTRHLLGGLA